MLVQKLGHGTRKANTTMYHPAMVPKEVLYCHNGNREDLGMILTDRYWVCLVSEIKASRQLLGSECRQGLAGRLVCMEIHLLQNQAHGLQWSHCSTAKEKAGPCCATNALCRIVDVFYSAWEGLFTQINYYSFFHKAMACFFLKKSCFLLSLVTC